MNGPIVIESEFVAEDSPRPYVYRRHMRQPNSREKTPRMQQRVAEDSKMIRSSTRIPKRRRQSLVRRPDISISCGRG